MRPILPLIVVFEAGAVRSKLVVARTPEGLSDPGASRALGPKYGGGLLIDGVGVATARTRVGASTGRTQVAATGAATGLGAAATGATEGAGAGEVPIAAIPRSSAHRRARIRGQSTRLRSGSALPFRRSNSEENRL